MLMKKPYVILSSLLASLSATAMPISSPTAESNPPICEAIKAKPSNQESLIVLTFSDGKPKAQIPLSESDKSLLLDYADIASFQLYKDVTEEALLTIDIKQNTSPIQTLDNIPDTHGKAFVWGYQVYFDHATMEQMASYDDISGGISTVIGALSATLGPAGIAVGALIGLLQLDWGIAKVQDKGDGVTLTNVLYVTPVHWYNSGNCARDGWF